ncbi:MAG: hypothetical protein NC822_03350 [Candidatus Omnitrophica bacterium]|nr:hypothetical protein [Candidatus Omnitrophota bacterium]
MNTEYKLLLSYPITKKKVYGYNEAMLDGSSQRFTKGQGIFTQTSHTHLLALHIIAQNLKVPCVVLEAPTEEDFREEVKKGYTHVALQSFSMQTEELFEMARIAKHINPQIKVIAGGYGIASVYDAIEKNPSLKPLIDYFCEGEGIEFCRKLFGEDTSAPIVQYLPLVSSSYPWFDYYKEGDCATILGGLGCTGLCEFCYTSHTFKGRYIEVANAEQIFNTMKMIMRNNPQLDSFIIYDEDFLKYEKKARRLGELICNDKEFGLRRLNYYCFGSNRSIAQYDFEELVLMGIQILFVGVESFYPDMLVSKNIEEKRSGRDIRETIRQLHKHGIYTLGAIIFGFDHHNRQNIVAEKRAFIELETTWYQINLLCAGPGTALWERMKKEGRVYEDFDYSMVHHYGVPLKHPNFERYELLDFVDKMYGEVYEFGGPTVLRILNISLNGYEYCKKSKNPLLYNDKAQYHERACKDTIVMMKAVKTYAPNGLVVKKSGGSRKKI